MYSTSSRYQMEMLAAGCGEIILLRASEDIFDGAVCFSTGSSQNRAWAGLANASSLATMPALYCALDDVSQGRVGPFLRRGIVRRTVFFEHSAPTILYVSATASGYDTTDPSAYTYIQEICVCMDDSWIDWAPKAVLDASWWTPE